MPDAPDWYAYRLDSTRHVLGDMAELAVRLGSIVSYDRLGTVSFVDSFDHGFSPFYPQVGAGSSAIVVVADPTASGGYSAKLTTDENDPWEVGMLKRVQPVAMSKFGLECTFSIEDGMTWVALSVQINDGSTRESYIVRWYPADGALKYRNSGGTYTEFGTQTLPDSDKYLFHTVKLVCDVDDIEYVKFRADQLSYSLADIAAYSAADPSDPRIEWDFHLAGIDTENNAAYLDNFIITIDEP